MLLNTRYSEANIWLILSSYTYDRINRAPLTAIKASKKLCLFKHAIFLEYLLIDLAFYDAYEQWQCGYDSPKSTKVKIRLTLYQHMIA